MMQPLSWCEVDTCSLQPKVWVESQHVLQAGEGDCCTLQESCSVRDDLKSVATECSAGSWMQIGMLEVS